MLMELELQALPSGGARCALRHREGACWAGLEACGSKGLTAALAPPPAGCVALGWSLYLSGPHRSLAISLWGHFQLQTMKFSFLELVPRVKHTFLSDGSS